MTAAELHATYGELASTVDAKTLELVDRRRGTSLRRGWIVRRMLLLADVVGLVLAFGMAELALGPGGGSGNELDGRLELVLFCLATIWLLRLLQGMLGRSIR